MIKFYTHRDGKDRQPMSDSVTCNHGVSIYSYKTTVHNGQCTYLNSGLLVAPRKYVLHGLNPGMY
jgi:hypothetical protein